VSLKKSISDRENIILVFAALLIIFSLQFQLIVEDPFTNYDDQVVVKPSKNIGSLKEYAKKIEIGIVPDVQPVRDFSYWTNWKILKYTGISSFHFTNSLIWFCCVVLLFLLFNQLFKSKAIQKVLVLFYVLNPNFINAVSWLSARKHLLSFMFILICTNLIIKTVSLKKQNPANSPIYFWFIPFVFCLSVLSHPINVFWPLWAIAYLYFNKKYFKSQNPMILWSTSILLVMLALVWINNYYYENIYFNFSLTQAISTTSFLTLSKLGTSFLAIGHHFFHTIFPFFPSYANQNPGDIRNLFGLFILPIFIFITLKTLAPKKTIPWLVYFVICLGPVISPIHSRMVIMKLYTLNGSIGILVVIGFMLQNFESQLRKYKNLTNLFVVQLVLNKCHPGVQIIPCGQEPML